MTLDALHGPLAYAWILLFAILEGEVAYVVAATLVGRGFLNPLGVMVAGAAGAAVGDQCCFYLLRGRLRGWLNRYDAIARRGQRLVAHVRRHEAMMVFLIRFAPGLRIALAAACAYADVSPIRFSLLNGLSSVVWAAGLLVIVAWLGPTYLPALGISGWWSVLVPPLAIVIIFKLVGRFERRALEELRVS